MLVSVGLAAGLAVRLSVGLSVRLSVGLAAELAVSLAVGLAVGLAVCLAVGFCKQHAEERWAMWRAACADKHEAVECRAAWLKGVQLHVGVACDRTNMAVLVGRLWRVGPPVCAMVASAAAGSLLVELQQQQQRVVAAADAGANQMWCAVW